MTRVRLLHGVQNLDYMKPTVQEVLKYLEDVGWTELIDSRWERQVIKDIQSGFPNIDPETLEYVLNLVLVH